MLQSQKSFCTIISSFISRKLSGAKEKVLVLDTSVVSTFDNGHFNHVLFWSTKKNIYIRKYHGDNFVMDQGHTMYNELKR